LGLGLQNGGLEAVNFFAELGCKIRISDIKTKKQLEPTIKTLGKYRNLVFEFEKHSAEFIKWADVIIRNPGVNLFSPTMKLAMKLNKEIVLPTAFFLKNCPLKSIGVTGTRGKSTTTSLIYETARKYLKQPVHLAGNLPQHSPFRLIKKVKPKDLIIVELSSWELQGFRDYKVGLNIALLTNIYPDHLNYYKNMDQYIDDKMQIIANQKPDDLFITLRPTYQKYQKQIEKYRRAQLILVEPNYYPYKLRYLPGKHNLENASLAYKTAQILKIDNEKASRIIQNFPGLEFRLQKLGTIKQSLFFNDSTSTTPVAGIKAIEAIKSSYPKKNLILVCGGKEKNLPFDEWLTIVNHNCQQIFLLPGSFSDLVEAQLKPKLTKVPDIATLFKKLIPLLDKTKVVLFSPGATSFATFNNEFERGNQFTKQFKIYQAQYAA